MSVTSGTRAREQSARGAGVLILQKPGFRLSDTAVFRRTPLRLARLLTQSRFADAPRPDPDGRVAVSLRQVQLVLGDLGQSFVVGILPLAVCPLRDEQQTRAESNCQDERSHGLLHGTGWFRNECAAISGPLGQGRTIARLLLAGW